MYHDLYFYIPKYYLLFDQQGSCTFTDNRPMNNKTLKLYKGVDNNVQFRVFDGDRKKARIEHLQVQLRFIFRESSEELLIVNATLVTKGLVQVLIEEAQLSHMPEGWYNCIITGSEAHGDSAIQIPLYNDADSSAIMEVYISGKANPTTDMIQKIDTWSETSIELNENQNLLYCSSPIKGNVLLKRTITEHLITLSAQNFRGLFQVRFNNDENAPPTTNQLRWQIYNIGYNNGDYLEFGDRDIDNQLQFFTGDFEFTIDTNVHWMAFYWIPADEHGVAQTLNSELDSENTLDSATIVIQSSTSY